MDKKCIVIFLEGSAAATYDGKPLMLQEVLFCPALTWCMRDWMKKGIRRFFVVCGSQYVDEVMASFPEGAEAGAGTAGQIAEFAGGCQIEEVRQAVFPVGGAMRPVDTLAGLLRLQQAAQEEIAAYHLSQGVSILSPATTCIDPRVTIGPGTVILPGTILRGKTVIGAGCQIGPQSMIVDCVIGDGCQVNASQAFSSTMGKGVHVGPYAHIRPKCSIGDKCKVGAFVEIKNASFGEGTKMAHLTYVGDAEVGSRVNFGCGTVTSNYDGFTKARAVIGSDVFVGCNTNLVSPVTVGDGAYIAAGTTVTKNVEADSLAIGRARQEQKPGWAKKRRDMHKK